MRAIKNIFSLSLILLCTVNIHAQGNLGQAGANFLQIAAEPRGAALGGAATATASGAAALYWNPAGATTTKNIDIILSHTDWFLDTKLAYGAIVKNFENLGTIGLSVSSFYMDAMEITTVYESEGTNQFYNAGDLALGLSYARDLTNNFTFGATIKYVHEYIWNETANLIAFDIGSVYRTGFYNLRIGMVIKNVSGSTEFEGDDINRRFQEEQELGLTNNPRIERLNSGFRLPQVFQMGIAFDPMVSDIGTLTLFTDVNVPSDNIQRLIFAGEYSFRNLAFLRAAYKMNYDTGTFSFGGGLNLELMSLTSRLDYSYSAHNSLGDIHRFSFGLSL